MSMAGLFERRVRGFRVVEVAGLGLLLALVLGVYLAKAFAGRERADIANIETQIVAEQTRVRLLRAEVAHLENPRRVEQLATSYLALAPIAATHETSEDALIDVARHLTPPTAPTPIAAEATPSDVLAADAPEAMTDDAPPAPAATVVPPKPGASR
jgi:cell division protein FtsL